jgi:hypothetical protein
MPNDLRKLLAPLAIITCCLVVAVLSCDDHGVVSPKPENPTLKYADEAECAALFYAGTLHAPLWLTKQISHELEIIRSTWADSVPEVKIEFESPWYVSSVTIAVDSNLLAEIRAGSNDDWNQLIKNLNVTVSEPRHPMGNWHFLYLSSTEKLHPVRLAEYFVGFPGVSYVRSSWPTLQEWDDFCARVPTSTGAKYFFKKCTCPDLWNAYFYFTVEGDSSRYLGYHYECAQDWYTGDPNRMQEIIDSIEAARPVWVDTARTYIWRLADDASFQWSRK